MYKILVSDFEDALIDEEDAISYSSMLAIGEVRKKDVAFCVLTKRNFKSILDYNKDFPFVDYIVVLNGSYIYDVNKDKPLFKRNIAISIIKKIYKTFEDYNLCFYTVDWCNYTKDRIDGDNVRKIGDFKVFSDFHRDNIFKAEILLPSKKEQIKALEELENLNLDIEFYARNTKEKGHYIEINSAECDRLDAISRICKDRKASLKETIVIGQDDDNINLFKKVGKSVAVANSSTKLRKVADDTTDSNFENGVQKAIKKYFDIV